MSYATVAEYRAQVDKRRTDDTAELFRDLSGSSDLIEQSLHTTFGRRYDVDGVQEAAKTSEDQFAYGNGTIWLRIEEPVFGEVVVREDGSTGTIVVSGNYRLIDTNSKLSFYMLKRTDGQVWESDKAYNINAKLGTLTTPPLIVQAVIEITALQRLETPRAFNIYTEYGTDEKRLSVDSDRFASYKRGLAQYAVYRP